MRKARIFGLIAFLSLQMVFISGFIKPEAVYAQVQENQTRISDEIVVKTRVYNGKRQYRRWNETKQCWVDPKWIDV